MVQHKHMAMSCSTRWYWLNNIYLNIYYCACIMWGETCNAAWHDVRLLVGPCTDFFHCRPLAAGTAIALSGVFLYSQAKRKYGKKKSA